MLLNSIILINLQLYKYANENLKTVQCLKFTFFLNVKKLIKNRETPDIPALKHFEGRRISQVQIYI